MAANSVTGVGKGNKAKTKTSSISSQGVFDIFSLFDAETIDKVKSIIQAIDPEKVGAVMDMIDPENNEIQLKIDLSIKK